MAFQTVADVGLLNAGSSATIGPTTANGQWIIHNVYIDSGSTVKLEYGDGYIWVNVDTVYGSMCAYYFHVTNNIKLRLTNLGSTQIKYGYDGVVVI